MSEYDWLGQHAGFIKWMRENPLSHNQRLDNLARYYGMILAEDKEEGTEFDYRVFEAIEALRECRTCGKGVYCSCGKCEDCCGPADHPRLV